MSFKPIDSRRDEFRKYLERSGVVDEFTKVLIKLFNTPERPENAIQFIFENLGHTLLQKDQYEYLKKELEDSRSEIAELKTIIEKLQSSSKIENQEQIIQTEILQDIKKEPLDIETSQQNNDVNNSSEEQISSSSSSEVQQSVEEEKVTSSKSEEKVEPLVEIKKSENIENLSSIPDQENNAIEEKKETKQTKVEDVKNTEIVSEKEKNAEVEPKENEEVTSTPNVKLETTVSEISPKDNTETVPSAEPEESTNKEKPVAEDNKEIKTTEEKK